MNEFILIVLISIVPFLELRGSMPIGIAMGINPVVVFSVCILANVAIIPVIFFALDFVFKIRFFKKYAKKIHKRAGKYIERYGYIGLTLFVAIPLPGSGAYSGSLLAYFLEMNKKKAMISIAVGVLIAGLLVSLTLAGVVEFANYFIFK